MSFMRNGGRFKSSFYWICICLKNTGKRDLRVLSVFTRQIICVDLGL